MSRVSLGDVVEIVMGQAPPGYACNKDGIGTVFVKAGEFQEKSPVIREWTTEPLKFAEPDDTLVCVVGATCGKVNYSSFSCAIGRSVAAVRAERKRIEPSFLFQFLQTKIEHLRDQSQGAAQGVVTREMIQRLHLVLPSLPEQRRIAAILDQADALRAKRREALAQLDRLTQAIFVEMFGDPTTNPLGWPRVNLGELIDEGPQNGLYKPSTDYGSGIPILRIDGFYDGVVTNLNALRRVRLSPEEVQLFGLRANDIVINRVNSLEYLGKSALIPELSEPTVFESNMMRLRMKSSVINPVYMVAFMQSGYVKSQILTCAKNAVNQSSINQQDVKGFSINVPPLSLQKIFDDRAQAIKSIHARQQSGLTDLDALFTSLQHRAFRGEL